MILTTQQVLALASQNVAAVQAAHDRLDAGVKLMQQHNATKGNAQIEAGSLIVARGGLTTALEQLAQHEARFTAALEKAESAEAATAATPADVPAPAPAAAPKVLPKPDAPAPPAPPVPGK